MNVALQSKLWPLIVILLSAAVVSACGDANDKDDIVPLAPDEPAAMAVTTTTVTTSTVE